MATTTKQTRAARGQSDRLSVHLTAETTKLVREAQAAEEDRLRREAPVTMYVDELVAQAALALAAKASFDLVAEAANRVIERGLAALDGVEGGAE